MTQCDDLGDNQVIIAAKCKDNLIRTCPSCGHQIQCRDKQAGYDLPELPAGVKFDPSDQEILEHLEGKVESDACAHPLIDEFIPTIDGENVGYIFSSNAISRTLNRCVSKVDNSSWFLQQNTYLRF
uniref:NAC protein 7 n=1 Tax=Casuarina equisetifolia TaxID=3523 RepID=A0AA49X7G9_CASEQ|nr:NAC protein 7 [Casuarina equisetifolia]